MRRILLIVDAPLPDLASEDFWQWCQNHFPHTLRVQIGPYDSGGENVSLLGKADICVPPGCDPLTLISLCEKGRWERTFSRVEHLLEVRTSDLRESEAQFKGLFDVLPAVLVIYDAQHIIKHINAAGAQQLRVCSSGVDRTAS